MTPEEILRLVAARNAYAYPMVHVTALRGFDVDGKDHPVPGAVPLTQAEWASTHRAWLGCQDPLRTQLGLVSVSYWGNYAASDPQRSHRPEFALARARIARDGRSNAVNRPSAALAAESLSAAVDYLARGAIAQALRAVNRNPQFGQMSFGSKVLMAMAPEQCGVYDKVIHDTLVAAGPAWSAYVTHPNQGMSDTKARVYQRWCDLLQRRAAAINAHGVHVSGWTDSADDAQVRRAWRAVDVERAFFRTRDVSVLGDPAAG